MSDKENKKKTEELNDEELEEVNGGLASLNPRVQQTQKDKFVSGMPVPGAAQTPVVKPSIMPTVKK